MVLKKTNLSNLNLIIELGRETYYDTFHAMNTEQTMSDYLNEAFNEAKIAEEMNNPMSEFYILHHEKTPSAYIKVNRAPAQSDINDPHSLELERIYVRKDYKGLGFGRFLINETVSLAKSYNCLFLWLGVWEKNTPALAFYRKMGFFEFGRHKFQMGEELQSDLLLKKTL